MNVKLTERDRIKVVDSEDVFAIMRKILLRENKIDQNKEHFWMVGLAPNLSLLFIELVSIGGQTKVSVNPREAFQVAVQKSATSVIMVHNHPNASLKPSEEDTDLTDHFIQAGRLLHIEVADHLIISDQTFFSFELNGLMTQLRGSVKYVLPYELEEKFNELEQKGIERGMRKGKREGKVEGLREGEVKGELNARKEIARAALLKGMEIDLIVEISGLSQDSIEKLS